MESKVCVICNTEKSIDGFHNKYRECKQCNIKRSLKRYYENIDELPIKENYIMRKIEMRYLQSLN